MIVTSFWSHQHKAYPIHLTFYWVQRSQTSNFYSQGRYQESEAYEGTNPQSHWKRGVSRASSCQADKKEEDSWEKQGSCRNSCQKLQRERKEKVLGTRQLNFMSKHSKVKLTKIFDIFSGVNVKTQDLGLKQHATNAEISQPTISLNNVMTLKIMPLKIAFIYFLPALSLPHPFPGT